MVAPRHVPRYPDGLSPRFSFHAVFKTKYAVGIPNFNPHPPTRIITEELYVCRRLYVARQRAFLPLGHRALQPKVRNGVIGWFSAKPNKAARDTRDVCGARDARQ